jgi:pimeloyl-ACP methyl ester carboxylesterase
MSIEEKAMSLKIFLHGLESSNQGTKAIFFRETYPDMLTLNFTGPLDDRMAALRQFLAGRSGIRLVGSSFGGLMGTIFAMENEPLVERLVLLAPAINLMVFPERHERQISVPVWIYHGSGDQVVPLGEVEPLARRLFRNLSFHVVDDDHFLKKTFEAIDWNFHLGE